MTTTLVPLPSLDSYAYFNFASDNIKEQVLSLFNRWGDEVQDINVRSNGLVVRAEYAHRVVHRLVQSGFIAHCPIIEFPYPLYTSLVERRAYEIMVFNKLSIDYVNSAEFHILTTSSPDGFDDILNGCEKVYSGRKLIYRLLKNASQEILVKTILVGSEHVTLTPVTPPRRVDFSDISFVKPDQRSHFTIQQILN